MDALQPVEQDDVVDAVEEFGPEGGLHRIEHLAAHQFDRLVFLEFDKILRAQVRRHDDDRVAEVDRAPLPVRQPPVIEHLQEDVEHIRMRLFDLVEKHDLVGPAANRFGQHTALVVTDIARRGADQAGNGMLLHELGHVEAHHRVLVVEEELGESLGELGLADARRPQEHERADRAVGVLQPGTRAPHGASDGFDRLFLADDALAERALHVDELVPLALEHLVDWNTGPARDDLRDIGGRHDLRDHLAFALALGLLGFLDPLLEAGDHAIGELTRLCEVARPLCDLELAARRVELFLELLRALHTLLLGEPFGRERLGVLFQFGEVFLEPLEARLGGLVGLLLERLALDLQLHDAPVEFVERLGLAVDSHAQTRCRLVHQVDGLVGQEAVRDVAVGKRGRGNDRRVRNADAVVKLVLLLEAAQDRDGVLDRGLAHEHGLEAAGQRGVLFHMLAIFIERRRAHAVELAARERRFQKVARIHRAVGLTGADERVHLVDEENDLALGGGDLAEDGLQPLFELAAILRAGDERTEVERHQRLALERFGYVAIDDTDGQAFGDGGLAHAGFTDEHGVVLGAAAQHLDGAADFLVAADHRIELAVAHGLGEVAGIFLERVVLRLGRSGIGGAALADGFDRLIERIGRDARRRQDLAGIGVLVDHQREQHALDRDEGVAGLLGGRFCRIENARQFAAQIKLRAVAAHLRDFVERGFDARAHRFAVAARPVDEAGTQPLVVVHQHLEQVHGSELLVAAPQRHLLRTLNEAARPLGVFFDIQGNSPFAATALPQRHRVGRSKR